MNAFRSINPKVATQIPEAPIARFLFADKRMGWFWLLVRLAVGLGLIFWCFTGIAAFFGLLLNINFMLSGVMDPNLVTGAETLFLILAWRIAGYYGVDHWLLPLPGTPWTTSLTSQKTSKAPKPSPIVP